MDAKTEILRWESAVQENPAIAVLGVILLIAVVFIAAVLIDSFLKRKSKTKKRRSGKRYR